jgi:heavy metal sensor kinase
MRLKLQSLRTRLILWHVLMLGIVLAVYIGGVSVLAFWQMDGVLKRLAAEDLETVKGLLFFSSDGQLRMREDYHRRTEWKQVAERLLEVLSPSGEILYRNELLKGRTIGGASFAGEGNIGYSERTARLSDGTPITVVSKKYNLDGQTVLIRVAYSNDLIWSRLEEISVILLLALPFALAAAAFAAYKVASKALDPIEKMAMRIERINSERLDERLPIENPADELGHLARVCNNMLGRIEQAFEQLRRFTADASHELRTPLAAIRSTGEVALEREAAPAEYREVIGSMLEEVNRLTGMVEGLLTLSRADAGQLLMQPSVFPLRDLMQEVGELLDVLIEEKQLQFEVLGDPAACVRADRRYLRQSLVNLLHNAVKFTPSGGSIKAHIERKESSSVLLSIADTGAGIPALHAEKVFERFYRVDQSRDGDYKGAGLGLSIAKWAIQANGGEVGVVNSESGGAKFWIRLPAVSSETVPQTYARA